jgi:hypothetical protein
MPIASKEILLMLRAYDVWQLLDGLHIRTEAWSKTADFLESGFNADDSFICEECSDPREARRIAQHYKRIIAEIEQQIERQGG